jgi:hypothetical protein
MILIYGRFDVVGFLSFRRKEKSQALPTHRLKISPYVEMTTSFTTEKAAQT